MASRILGFGREMLIAASLGAGPVADAFYAAFTLPNLFRRIFAEGAFNSAFIPLFAKELESGGIKSARQFGEEVLAVLVAVLLLFSALAMIFMPEIVAVFFKFGDGQKLEITSVMARVMFPYLFCMSLIAMLSGVLNSMRRYFFAAIVPVLLNVILIALLLISVALKLDERSIGLVLSWGVLGSGIVQLVLLFFGAAKQDFRVRLVRPRLTPQVRRLLVLMGPAVLTGGVIQINILIGRMIASAQDGAISLLNYADRINQLPLGVIGIAIGVVLLPELSRSLNANDLTEATKLQSRSLEISLLLTLPAAVGFMVIPEPIVALLFERGAFDATTTAMTAAALAAYAAGLPAYVLIKVFQPAYFAREDMRTPFYFSIVMMVANIAVSLALFPYFGHVGIAIATAISAWVNFALLAVTLWMRNQYRPESQTLRRVMMIIVASLVMGVLLYFGSESVAGQFTDGGLIIRMLLVLTLIGTSAIIYFVIIILSGVISRAELQRILRRAQ